jgi:hypothetical protein
MPIKLNLPEYSFKTKQEGGKKYIFDHIRKKYVAFTPEEWVRQNFLMFLISEKQYPPTLINTETCLSLNKLSKRCDIIVFNRNGDTLALVECKAPDVKISQAVFDQIARYTSVLKAKALIVTNGMSHYCCLLNTETQQYSFIQNIPSFKDLLEEKPLDR